MKNSVSVLLPSILFIEKAMKQYKWGIPTCTDVQCTSYQNAKKREKLAEKLEWFLWPISDMSIHNHVVDIVNRLYYGGYTLKMIESVYKGSSWTFLGTNRRIREHLDPRMILQRYLKGIRRWNKALEQARKYVDKDVSCLADVVENIPPHVSIEPLEDDWKIEGYNFRTTYNPYKLAKDDLRTIKKELKKAYNSSSDKIKQIRALYKVVKCHDDWNDPVRRYIHGMGEMVCGSFEISELEDGKCVPAQLLKEENEAIAEKSDVYVRFDLFYLVVKKEKGTHMVPFEGLFEEPYLTASKLSSRKNVRDLISDTDNIVINGVAYQKVYDRQFLKNTLGYRTEGETQPWVANLFGYSIETAKGITEPDEWVRKEMELVWKHT